MKLRQALGTPAILQSIERPPWPRVAVLALMVGGILLAHYSTSPDDLLYHHIFRRSMYLPIILAAVWFGTAGGVLVALTAALLYAPHMFFQLQLAGTEEADRIVEMLLYVIVGGITGLLVERQTLQRRRTEQALTKLQGAHAELRQQATHLAEVEEALRQAERMSTLGTLAADLAHEIRNPLATMRGTVQILAGAPPEREKREFVEILIGEMDRLNGVVEGYLRAARPGTLGAGHCDAVMALNSVVELTRWHAERNGIAIELTGADHLPVPMQMSQATEVFMNLTLNAIQAMPEGGRLRVGCRIAPQDGEESAWGEMTFADTGPGVSAADQESIFRPFFTTKSDGTGLGLSIARRLVEQHGGSLTLDPARNDATVFRVRLPLSMS